MTSNHRPLLRLVTFVTSLLLLLSACSDPIPISATASPESASADNRLQAAPTVGVATSEFGDILVNTAGMSLYGFTDDVDGVSTCEGGCAGAWPPVLVASATLPADLDASVFSVVARPDGTNQLKAGTWPLYLFAGDTAPGQTTGHLSGDVWFLVTPDAKLVGVAPEAAPDTTEPAVEESAPAPAVNAPALASTASSGLGDLLVSGAGLTLYGFTNDTDGVPTCEGGCAEAWPPILVDGAALPADLDPAVFSVVARPDGKNQLKAGTWPLYLFAGDTAPGQTTGHLSGDVWFAVSPSGALIDAAPSDAPASDVPSADQSDETSAADDASDGYGYDTGTAAAQPATASIGTAASSVGNIIVDQAGRSIYGFTKDSAGVPTCEGGCAEAWPPVLVPSGVLPAGLDAAIFSVVQRPDRTHQLKAGKWPLYLFAGDTAAGQTNGHLSGNVWFLASPDGKLIGFTPPAPAPAVAAPTAAPASAPVQPAPTAAVQQVAPAPTAAPAYPTPAPVYATPAPYGSSDY